MLSYNQVHTKIVIRDGHISFGEGAWELSHQLYSRYLNGESYIVISGDELDSHFCYSFELYGALRERGIKNIRVLRSTQVITGYIDLTIRVT